MKNKTFLNIFAAFLLQFANIAYGFIIPKLILSTFGSEVNGLVSSINQFLNYISLVEGGLGSVYLTALYKPLAKNDVEQLSEVFNSARKYFCRIGIFFAFYAALLSVLYPLVIKSSQSYFFVSSLIIVLAISLLTQYCFSITYRLLIQADQKSYIVLFTQSFTTILTIIFTFIIIKIFPNIHVLKFMAALVYIFQPIFYGIYVKKHYNIVKRKSNHWKDVLKDRWSCASHHIAFFINSNTDITILSIIKGLLLVSVYSVYSLVTIGIRSLFNSFSQVFSPKIGNAIALENINLLDSRINEYEYFNSVMSSIIFGTSMCMILPFVSLYTKGINDATYIQPFFACLILLAELLYGLRHPYIAVIYGAKQYKNTSWAFITEAIINIGISFLLVQHFGLIGIAIGTVLAMLFGLIFVIMYLKKNIIYRKISKSFKRIFVTFLIIISGFLIYTILTTTLNITFDTYFQWLICTIIVVICFIILTIIINIIFDSKITISLIKRSLLKIKKVNN